MRNTITLNTSDFEQVLDGRQIGLISLTDGKGLFADVTNYGGRIVTLKTPCFRGELVDVVLGHDTMADYIQSEEQYFGAIIGRYGNRISKGKFRLDGKEYTLHINNGPNSLHGGVKGFNSVVWQIEEKSESHLHLSYTSADGEEGFPGELKADVIYRLHDGELQIEYTATTTSPTIINLTNHSYFNLSGEGTPSVHDHILRINANQYLPTNEFAIPYGEPTTVVDTPFDFREPHGIGDRIETPIDQLMWARGYDHTFVLNKPEGVYEKVASCWSPETKIEMNVLTTEPGLQLYTGNWMTGNMRGKGNATYPARSALCLETQHYPDSPNKPDYPSVVLRPGEVYYSQTSYRFSISDGI